MNRVSVLSAPVYYLHHIAGRLWFCFFTTQRLSSSPENTALLTFFMSSPTDTFARSSPDGISKRRAASFVDTTIRFPFISFIANSSESISSAFFSSNIRSVARLQLSTSSSLSRHSVNLQSTSTGASAASVSLESLLAQPPSTVRHNAPIHPFIKQLISMV